MLAATGAILAVTVVQGQQILWASEVVQVSSALADSSNAAYGAAQLLGPADVYPQGGPLSRAWMPATIGAPAFIRVKFPKKITVRQIGLFETNHPGTLTRIEAYDAVGTPQTLLELTPVANPLPARLLMIKVGTIPFATNELSIYFDGAAAAGRIGVDAIAITDDPDLDLAKYMPAYLTARIETNALGRNINSSHNELNPIQSPDGKELYFSRKDDPANIGRSKDEDIWYARRDSITGEWMPAEPLTNLNTKGPNFISSMSSNEDTLFLLMGNAYKRNKVYGGVSTAHRTHSGWSKPVNLRIEDFYNRSARGSFFMTADRKVLLLSLKRDEGEGGNDLFVAHRNPDGRYSAPASLGNKVNSRGDEITPFIMPDGKTLYFASNRADGMGGLDLYASTRLDESWTNWSEPRNLGPEINSNADELNLNFSHHDLLFVRGSAENTDIFKIDSIFSADRLPTIFVQGKVVDGNDRHVATEVNVLDGQQQILDVKKTDADGDFEMSLQKNKAFGLQVDRDSLASDIVEINSGDDTVRVVIRIKTPEPQLQPQPGPDPMAGNTQAEMLEASVYFAFGKFTVSGEYAALLDNMASRLQALPGENVLITGHADAIGDREYNLRLSKERAMRIKAELVKRGIRDTRITVVAKGEDEPKFPNTKANGSDNPEGRKRNRRADITIMGHR